MQIKKLNGSKIHIWNKIKVKNEMFICEVVFFVVSLIFNRHSVCYYEEENNLFADKNGVYYY